jgi:phosphoserine phosphatase
MSRNCQFYCYKNERKKNTTVISQGEFIELVIFDMDGVLVDVISSWKHIHDYFKTSNEHSVDAYLHGKIDDLEFIKRDVSLWKDNNDLITLTQLQEILRTVPLMQGAQQTIQTLKKHRIQTAIVSAGLDILANQIAHKLGIDYSYANGVEINAEGRLTGHGILGVKLMYKDEAVQHLSEKSGIPLSHCATIGNSCFDIPMFITTGIGIAFNPSDDCVREAADYIVDGKDLRNILPVLQPYLKT